MRFEKVTCDACERDLTTRTNIEDYRLVLASESKPGYGGGAYTAMGIYPAVNRTHHFCGLQCLDLWRDREKHKAKLWSAFHDSRRTDLGGGVSTSPNLPREEREQKESEFAKASLEAFPMPQRTTRQARPIEELAPTGSEGEEQ